MSGKYDGTMQMICDAAKFKMALNSHKGDIEQLSIGQSVLLCQKELEELLEADDNDDYEAVLVEVADAFNFLVGIAHFAVNEYRRRKNKGEPE